ncbi:hypothetical protein ElyMa_004613800 [Elysia marginata]|uniref:Uncharacterized protein n=1 Tax=Elysia marginata TaxID=1093978 RepID=A0AAV4HZN4_9GAST|nr:hypothetical protein ElyMa_004613800 [Elysia marginata]
MLNIPCRVTSLARCPVQVTSHWLVDLEWFVVDPGMRPCVDIAVERERERDEAEISSYTSVFLYLGDRLRKKTLAFRGEQLIQEDTPTCFVGCSGSFSPRNSADNANIWKKVWSIVFHRRRQSQDFSYFPQQANTHKSKLNSHFRALQHACQLVAQILTFYKFQALPIASTHFTGGWTEESVDKLQRLRWWESNPRPPDHKSDALTTEPRCSGLAKFRHNSEIEPNELLSFSHVLCDLRD